jgi:hypothetical protein
MDGNIIYADSFHGFSFHAPGYKVFPCGSLIKTWSNIVNKALEMEPNETKHVHWAPKKSQPMLGYKPREFLHMPLSSRSSFFKLT